MMKISNSQGACRIIIPILFESCIASNENLSYGKDALFAEMIRDPEEGDRLRFIQETEGG
jgi:hypothetical protein